MTFLFISYLFACGSKEDIDVSVGPTGSDTAESSTEQNSQEPSSSCLEPASEPGNSDTGGFDAGTPDDTSDDPEGGPECAACGWFCTCETGSDIPSDWHDCSVGYDCLDHCINAAESPEAEWFTCVMNTGGEDCDAVFECGYPSF